MHETFFLVLGLVGLLTIASLLLPIANRINFPYTVLLAVAGSVLGGIVLAMGKGDYPGMLGDFLSALDALDITSEAVFFVFLPALIFESTLNINARHLMEDIGPILLLAVIGLLISTWVVGLSVWTVSSIGLITCLLLGAIVSATDPVAVVAIFKGLGAPKRLTILVEGESLFNDATAIVMFTILMAILTGRGEASVLTAVGNFVKVFLGGIVVGLVTSWLMASVIGRLRNLPLAEITLTICLAYLTFLLAEHYLHVSGVMAVVTTGLMINSFGRTQVSPETWHALTETWEELAFWANSLIFFLVGLLVPKVLVGFTGADVVTLVALIGAAFFARAVVLFAVLPSLNRIGLGQQISVAFRTVMLWGGLRGAVSLALALVILESQEIAPESQKFVVVLVTAFVLFTLFVNAPTMGMMMRLFGLDKLPPVDLAIRNRVMVLSLSHIRAGLERAAQQDKINPAIATEVADDYDGRLTGVEETMVKAGQLPDEVLQRVGLTTLLNHERQLYLERFSEGLVSAKIARILLAQVDTLLDGLKAGGVAGYQDDADKTLGFGPVFRSAMLVQRRFGVTYFLAAQLASRFEVLCATEAVVRTLIAYTWDKIPSLLGDTLARELERLLTSRLEATRQALEGFRLQYPEYARTVQKRHLARIALRLEEADYIQMLDEQVISQEVFNDLVRDLNKRARTLDRQPSLDLGLDPDKLVAQVPFFADLEPARIVEIVKLLKPCLAVPSERVVHKGEVGDAMYFISSGAVEVGVEPEPVRLGNGDFFGELALLTQQPRTADVTAIGYCQLLALYGDDFRLLLDAYPDLHHIITRVAHERLKPEKLVAKVPLFAALGSDHIAEIAKLLKPRLAVPGEQVVHKGEVGDAMYFIAIGAVEVAAKPRPVRLGRGDFFGELALLTRQPRIADVTAIAYCQLLALYGDDFRLLLDAYPDLHDTLTRVARERLGVEVANGHTANR